MELLAKYKKPCFIGDQHGDLNNLINLLNYCEMKYNPDVYIQVGDLGLMGRGFENFLYKLNKKMREINKVLYFIDGNHENHRWLKIQCKGHKKLSPVFLTTNICYMQRGTLQEMNGYKLLFLGGAFSTDRITRKVNKSYWEEELWSKEEFEEIYNHVKNQKVDIIVSHDHTEEFNIVYNKHFPFKNYSSQSDYYKDLSHKTNLSKIVDKVNPSMIISGHYHNNVALYLPNKITNIILDKNKSDYEEQIFVVELKKDLTKNNFNGNIYV